MLSHPLRAVLIPVFEREIAFALTGRIEKGVVGHSVGFGFGDLDGSSADVEGAPGVS